MLPSTVDVCEQLSIASYCFRELGTALFAVLRGENVARGAVNCFLVVSNICGPVRADVYILLETKRFLNTI
jgi:hypothetical protein